MCPLLSTNSNSVWFQLVLSHFNWNYITTLYLPKYKYISIYHNFPSLDSKSSQFLCNSLRPTHLCLFSVTLSSSQTSLECGERTTCTAHSSRTAMAQSGPATRASIRVRLSGLIFPLWSAEPLDQLLPFTPAACSESPLLLHCWDNWIKSFHSSMVCGSTPGRMKKKRRGSFLANFAFT